MYYVYILTGKKNHTLYIGVTNDLARRLREHGDGVGSRFTQLYHVRKLIYFEEYREVTEAVAREKQLKGWSREKKEALIDTQNPLREDLGNAFL